MIFRSGSPLLAIVAMGAMITGVGFCDSPPKVTPTAGPASGSSTHQSLAEYARGRSLQGTPSEKKSSILITDENLKGMAAGKELTAVTRESSTPLDPEVGPEAEAPKAVWRKRVKGHLDTLRTLENDSKVLNGEIAELWRLFYACDEPEERDGIIRPRLKQRTADQTEILLDLDAAQNEFHELLADARRDGALPGWFRDLVN